MALVGAIIEGTERSIARAIGVPTLVRGEHRVEAGREWEGLLVSAKLVTTTSEGVNERALQHDEVIGIAQTGDIAFAEGVVYDPEEQRIYLPESTLRVIGEVTRTDPQDERRFIIGCIADGKVFDTALVVLRDDEFMIERGLDEVEISWLAKKNRVSWETGVSYSNERLLAQANAGASFLALRVA